MNICCFVAYHKCVVEWSKSGKLKIPCGLETVGAKAGLIWSSLLPFVLGYCTCSHFFDTVLSPYNCILPLEFTPAHSPVFPKTHFVSEITGPVGRDIELVKICGDQL